MEQFRLLWLALRAVWAIFLSFLLDFRYWWIARQAESLPVTEALIQASLVRHEIAWQTEIHYEYRIEGQYYAGSLRRDFLLPQNAQEWVGRFPERSRVFVHYKPGLHSWSFLTTRSQQELPATG